MPILPRSGVGAGAWDELSSAPTSQKPGKSLQGCYELCFPSLKPKRRMDLELGDKLGPALGSKNVKKKDTKGIWGPAWTLDPCHQGTKASLAFTHFPGVLPFDFWLGRKRELEVAGCGKFVLALNLPWFAPNHPYVPSGLKMVAIET